MRASTSPAIWRAISTQNARRMLHATARRRDITKFQMPAMSPTMTEGGIAEWKKKEGEPFTAGEVLLEIETDKATIDVEAQEDGVMGKIITPNGAKNVPVGKIIALLAQQGDDISNLEIPPEETTTASSASSSSASSTPSSLPSSPSQPVKSEHPSSVDRISDDRPFFPSVLRLLEENNISDSRSITGTGVRGMLTKGDVLAHLGKASGPNGTFKDNTPTPSVYKSQAVLREASPVEKKMALDPLGIRQVILNAFLDRSAKARAPPPLGPLTFESVIADYVPSTPARHENSLPTRSPKTSHDGHLDGLY